ncbi:MAG TPA: metallopeptidase family protein [Bacillota bacterium]|jgi:predicted Zn-dependent protease with MMP-like domain|nr:metallopeptidase family protein [Peptococcaceae bacterium MAG4]NLW37551.1 metallopeptidase family protein [Peptococcaceae bacterium]HPU36065.1 metallopeptidase family protein [Bacillota bacterium]HPZ43779.1 metallopeptidase family protein [Bacillota bacterium]HQD76298.1 metallopeptidase family protein [Bacillota bacterium]
MGDKAKNKKYRILPKKIATLSLDEFEALATALIDRIPERLCTELNGGFLLLPDVKKDGDFYVMGEYVEDEIMGCSIILYYGSFVNFLGDSSPEEWEEELWDTIVHELRHHLESLAGMDDLVREEMAEIEAYYKKH